MLNEDRDSLFADGARIGASELEEQYRNIAASKPKLRYCEWFDEDSNMWDFSRHTHPYHELIYYIAGKGDVDVSGTNIAFSLYDTVIYPAYHEHKDKRIPESRREIICLWIDMPEMVFDGPMRIRDRDGVLFFSVLEITLQNIVSNAYAIQLIQGFVIVAILFLDSYDNKRKRERV